MIFEPIMQGRLLDTKETKRLSDDQYVRCNYNEQCMMFRNFYSTDKGKSRKFLAQFNSPNECKKFVDDYNELIHTIIELKHNNIQLQKYKEMYEDILNG